VYVNGTAIDVKSPSDAINYGIGMIHQHFMLVPSLTVAENVALGMKSSRGFVSDVDRVATDLLTLSEEYHLKVDPHAPIWQLAVGEQQRVEILRALYRGAELLILDEPTAVLTPQEVDDLFNVLRTLAADGRGLIFISHKLHEVLAISDRITVLRDGRKVNTIPVSEATKPILAEMMVGRPVLLEYHRADVKVQEPRLTLENVSALSNRGDEGLHNVSFSLHAGEILAVAGVSGNGQHELAQVITGLRPATSGTVRVTGENVTNAAPVAIKSKGVSYIPEERMIDGVIKDFTVAENLVLHDHGSPNYTVGRIFMNFRKIAEDTLAAIRDYEIKTPGHETPIKNLSGGNIQKLVLARELAQSPRVLIAAQPTRGVDIGATEYIHSRLLEEREKGTAVLLISEDLDEIRALSDRIMVMFDGEVVGIVNNGDVTVEQIGLMMTGTALDTH
ncbi:MAG: ABC transporter ATP-binding protein, partial [Chloroflexota bacterium]